jgi:hypothetical protein
MAPAIHPAHCLSVIAPYAIESGADAADAAAITAQTSMAPGNHRAVGALGCKGQIGAGNTNDRNIAVELVAISRVEDP